jgi:nitrite reductase (NADH) small subunit
MAARGRAWTRVCRLEDIDVEGGVTALVDGLAVAVFRTWDDRVFALGNYDPFSKASVLSRGIVGTRGEVPFVASPMYKQAFDLRDGQCLDDRGIVGTRGEVPFVASPMYKQAFDLRDGQCLDDVAVRVPAYDVRVAEGDVLVGDRKGADTS